MANEKIVDARIPLPSSPGIQLGNFKVIGVLNDESQLVSTLTVNMRDALKNTRVFHPNFTDRSTR